MSYKKLLKKCFYALPGNRPVYSLCKRYVDFFNGENNHDIATNGELRFMRQALPECKVVFDVGANIGQWTNLALSINSRLAIHCFEPGLAAYQALLSQQFNASVICHNFGLSSADQKATLYVFDQKSPINSLYRRQGLASYGLTSPKMEETVSLTTLDYYCDEAGVKEIDYLKIDVEGHELEVFKGASQTLQKGIIRIIQFEYGGTNIDARVLLKDMFEFLQQFGYVLYKIYPKALRRVDDYDQELENFQYQNWIAMHGRKYN